MYKLVVFFYAVLITNKLKSAGKKDQIKEIYPISPFNSHPVNFGEENNSLHIYNISLLIVMFN